MEQQRLATSDGNEEYCDAVEEFSKDAKELLGLVAPVRQTGVPFNFGKCGAKGEGTCIRDLDIRFREVSSEVLEAIT